MNNIELIGKYISLCSFKSGKGRVLGTAYRGTAEELFRDITARMITDSNNPAVAFAYGHKDEIVKHLQAEMDKTVAVDEEKKEKYFFTTSELEKWLDENTDSWRISADGSKIEQITRYGNAVTPVPSDFDVLATAIYTDLYNQKLFCGKDTINAILKSYLNNRRGICVAKIADAIAYNRDNSENPELRLNKMLIAIYKFFKIAQPYPVFETAMKHWAWTVKRKLLGLEVRNHLWISFQGEAKTGKTQLMKRLTKPFEGFAPQKTMRSFLETTKEIKVLSGNYILYIDELAVGKEDGTEMGKGLSADDVNNIKSLLTGTDLSARVYHTQDQSARRLTFSVISTSNTHLYDVLYDPTTMRRFLEFDCMVKNNLTIPQFQDFEKMTSDAVGFWQGIDENLEYGYLLEGSDVYKQIDAYQNEYYPTNKTTWVWAQWIARGGYKPEEGKDINNNFLHMYDPAKVQTVDSLYNSYKNFCKESELIPSSRPNFEKFLAHFIPEFDIKGAYTKEEKSKAFDRWIETSAKLKEIPPEWNHAPIPKNVEENDKDDVKDLPF